MYEFIENPQHTPRYTYERWILFQQIHNLMADDIIKFIHSIPKRNGKYTVEEINNFFLNELNIFDQ